jgi:hypothetical protein
MASVLEQAINCEDGERAAKIIQDALGIENTALGIENTDMTKSDFTKSDFGKAWPADRRQRGRIIGEWLQMEANLQADRNRGKNGTFAKSANESDRRT